MPKLTPAMQQYADMKKQHPDCILFFRLGDFYEMFWEDAKISSKLLDLTLTSKNKNAKNPIPMAGVPHHSVEKYIQKLISLGYKVAVAEQTSTPQAGKLVEREIVSIITPGNYIQESSQDTNYMMSITELATQEANYHCARGDFSLGKYYTKSFKHAEELLKRIITLQIKEILLDPDLTIKDQIENTIQQTPGTIISLFDIPTDCTLVLTQLLQVQKLEGYGLALSNGRLQAATLLFNYLQTTQKNQLTAIHSISHHHAKNMVYLDQTTIKNLEIFTSSYENNPKHSLYGVINACNTNMGARMLREWLLTPSTNLQKINQRLSQIEQYIHDEQKRKTLIEENKNIQDIPKIVATILYRKDLPSYFLKLKNNLSIITKTNYIQELKNNGCPEQTTQKIEEFQKKLEQTIQEEISDETIDYIKDGVDETIDKLRQTAYHSDQLLIDYQQEIVKKTKLNNIKIKYTNNIGYTIEITPKDVSQFESSTVSGDHKFDFIRRQTLKSSQRYISSYLEQLQIDILSAKTQLAEKEKEQLSKLKQELENYAQHLTILCDHIAELDIYSAHAQFALEKKRSRPRLKTDGDTQITEARHPVIEELLPKEESFIPNNLNIGSDGYIHIITGPNMGGKSTFLRQNAIIVLLAQAGLYTPTKQASIKIVDGIFARVGSGDAIAQNQSTFMTEMIEVANILHNASQNSFIIFDEIGRGTATYDGLAISKAIIEHLHENLKAQTLIATHYHELTKLEKTHKNIRNFSVSVYETDKEVVFLKKIVKGAANRSYGIEVAKIAGIPKHITEQARLHLQHLEDEASGQTTYTIPLFQPKQNNQTPKHIEERENTLESIDVNNLTPLEALQIIAKLKNTEKN